MSKHWLLAVCGFAVAASASVASMDVPLGRLPDTATPTAYRLNMTILPDQPRFSGHTEIDVILKTSADHLYIHGRDLNVRKAVAINGVHSDQVTWIPVDPTGVVRLNFASPLPAGKATLIFDFDGAFGESAAGLYHEKIGSQWYSWTFFESINARAAFPSFDEPGFKTPFKISITTYRGYQAISNAQPSGVTRAGDLETHEFEPTRPLPTYLVAFVTGPFVRSAGSVQADAERTNALPLGIIATQSQAERLEFARQQTPRIVTLLEEFFGSPFPFSKLDQVASPEQPGGMENAGADIYNDHAILLDAGASVTQKQHFGSLVSHELAHQWFGDLVTSAWWDDIWLNESFATWMGYRIGDAWQPNLDIAASGLVRSFSAMDVDELEVGRPIHQSITTNNEIDSAFDEITYSKGKQVIAMIADYMGEDRFRSAVRLHLTRHSYGSATTEQFFTVLGEAANDPRIVAVMRSFVDHPGVPLVSITREGERLRIRQSRYAVLGSQSRPEAWLIPFCLRIGPDRTCPLVDGSGTTVGAPSGTLLVPNARGVGYYRFELPLQDWVALIGALPRLPPGEALAVDDSLWASFRAGRAPPHLLLDEARVLLENPDATARVAPGARLTNLRQRGLIDDSAVGEYRRVMSGLYAGKLKALSFTAKKDAYIGEAPDRQELRRSLVQLVSEEAQDPSLNAELVAAGQAFLDGSDAALDESFMPVVFSAYARAGGIPAAKKLMECALSTENSTIRRAVFTGLPAAERKDVGGWLLAFEDLRLRLSERITLVAGLAQRMETRDMAGDWLINHYEQLAAVSSGIAVTSHLPSILGSQCSAASSLRIDQTLGPKARATGAGGVLDFERTIESVRHCGDLLEARHFALAEAFANEMRRLSAH